MSGKLKPHPFFAATLVAMLLFAAGCSPTKHVPKGKQLLIENQVLVNNEREPRSQPKAVIRQKPNKNLSIPLVNWVIWRPYLQLYNLGNPEKEKGFSHWLTEIGEPPTVLDSTSMLNSARQLGLYYFNEGFFLNEVEANVDYLRDSTRARVIYKIYTGPQYYFGNLEYIISSPGIANVLNENREKTLVERGTPYNAGTLEQERTRIVNALRNSGYFGFPKTLVRFEADTSAGEHNVNIRMIVSDQPAAIGDSLYYIEHQPFTIRNVYINPNYNFSSPPKLALDTAYYKGLVLLQNSPVKYKPSYIESAIHFRDGELYNESKVRETYAHLTGNRVFQIAEVRFAPVAGDTTNQLDATILLQPYLKNTFTAEIEGTNTAGNYGVSAVLTWATRNIFHGGEILDVSIKGGLEAQVNISENNIFNTREIGLEVGLNFPRFVLFGNLNTRIPKRMEPKSRLYTSFNYQTRVEFERTIFAVGLLYTWRESRTKLHQVNLVDVNYVRLPRIDQDYLNSLEFKSGFQDNLIAATRYTFLYDNQKYYTGFSSQFFRGSIESSGNLLAALNGPANFEQDPSTEQYKVLGVPYAQYIKIDADFRNYFHASEEHQVVTRFFMGATMNYGNTPFLPPFEKSFLAGGSNDIRGWVAYRLGPGNFPKHLYSQGNTSYAAVAPFKMLASIEYRFPIIKSFKGALFADAGNIWLWNRDYSADNPGPVEQALLDYGIFKFDTFYKQVALNTGIGWRYDFGFFALRLDMGIKIYDPTEPENQRFVLGGLKWNTINYNIALGYPF